MGGWKDYRLEALPKPYYQHIKRRAAWDIQINQPITPIIRKQPETLKVLERIYLATDNLLRSDNVHLLQ